MTTMRHAVEFLDTAASRSPEFVFLRGSRPATLFELAAQSHAIAAWLCQLGITPGDRLLIVTANRAESIAAAFGAARAGITFAFLHHTVRPATFRRIVQQTQPACVVLDSATLGLRSIVTGVPVLTIGVSGTVATIPMEPIISSSSAGLKESTRTDPLCLVYTSGSTGEPRGVMVSHGNVDFTVAAIQQRLHYRQGDVLGLFLPLSFDYGLYQIFLALNAGAAIYLAEPDCVPLRLLNALTEGHITVLPGIPSLFSALVRMLERAPQPLPCLRAVTNTGERLSPVTIARLRALLPQLDVFLMYGLTECKRVSILLPNEMAAHPGSVGRPLDGTSAEIIEPSGRIAPDGVQGELVVRGPHVTMGYWRAPDETARHFRVAADGTRVLFTGDTCRRSADGYLYFEGRDGAQSKRRGFRISLLEIESAALAVAGAVGAAAIAVPQRDELHLFVASGDSAVATDAVLRELRERLEPYKMPDRIHVVASLPTTPHGKVDQQRLYALAGVPL